MLEMNSNMTIITINVNRLNSRIKRDCQTRLEMKWLYAF